MTDNKDITKDVKKKTLQARDKALEVKKGALEKTADVKDSAIMKTSEIKESASKKTSEIKENTSNKTEEFKGNAEKTRKQAENKNKRIYKLSKGYNREEFGKTISDYTSVDKPLIDIINTEDNLIIKADLPLVKKEDCGG